MQNYAFIFPMSVRDYECDMQGIVNNSVYQNYLEHARHEYLRAVGMDFKMYAQEGVNLVVVRAELDYKYPLESGDKFIVGLNMVRESKLKFVFYQDIFREKDKKLILKAKITGTALNQKGRPEIPEKLDTFFQQNSANTLIDR